MHSDDLDDVLHSFFDVVDVDSETILVSSASFLKLLVVELLSAEAGHSHVSRLVRQILVTQLARTLSHDSIVEWFWLIELFSVLSSILVGVSDSLSGPARAVPEGRVHHVARAIIKKGLSRSVQIGLVLNVLMNLNSFLLGELLRRISVLKHGLWLRLRVNIAGSERGLVRSVF